MRIFPMRMDLQQFLNTFSIASPTNKKKQDNISAQFCHHRWFLTSGGQTHDQEAAVQQTFVLREPTFI